MTNKLIKSLIQIDSEEQMLDLGAKLFHLIQEPKVIALHGTLGAGKSTLVRGFIHAFSQEEVPSPTFTLLQTYTGPKCDVFHFDFYRLENPEDALELNIEEAFYSGICFLEWPEKIGKLLPKKRLDITITPLEDTKRLISFAEHL